MGPTMADLGIDRMSSDHRVDLALEIWESLGDAMTAPPISEELRATLLRRDADMETDETIGLTWLQIRAHAEGVR